MKESELQNILTERLAEKFKEYDVNQGKSLLYKIIVGPEGKIEPTKLFSPSRGQYAFQTDILFSKNGIPRIIIELKTGGFNTHQILTYSTKAQKHKQVYPYLRYGFIVLGSGRIDQKFFIHNIGFDFAVSISSIEKDFDDVMKVIHDQLNSAETMIELNRKKTTSLPKIYSSVVQII